MPRKAFQLPSRWYRETTESIFDDLERDLGPLTPSNAWIFIYSCVSWYEESPKSSGRRYLHVNDRLKSANGKELATRVDAIIRAELPKGRSFEDFSGRIYDAYGREIARQGHSGDYQRNNITGAAFEFALLIAIERLCQALPERTPRLNSLAGFELAPEGYHSRPDIILFSPRDFRLLISTKWTLRKERIGTYLHEAYFYKRRRPDLQVAFVLGEFNLNILEWLCEDPLADRVYHVNKKLLLDAHRPFLGHEGDSYPISLLMDPNDRRAKAYTRWAKLQSKLFDLSQLFTDISILQKNQSIDESQLVTTSDTDGLSDDD